MVTLTRNVFTRMPGKSYRRRLESLLLCLCDVFPAVTNSLECWFCTGTLGLNLFQTVTRLVLLPSLVYWAVQWSWFARVNALCNLSRKKSREVAASLPGRFQSRHCFTLRVTMEVEPRIAMQHKCQHCCSCKKILGKGYWLGGGGGGGVSLRRFLAEQKKSVLGHPIARTTSYCLLLDTFWLRTSKNAFNVGSVKFINSLSPPSIVKKVRTESKSSQWT